MHGVVAITTGIRCLHNKGISLPLLTHVGRVPEVPLSKKLLMATCALTLGLYTGSVQAQTSNMTATATVQNVLTLTTPSQLNFGTIVAIADTANTASVAIDTVGNVVTASTGIPAYTVVVDDSAAAAAQITVADGADGALINITIDNVVGPVNGTTVFDLDDFTTSWNGNAANTQVIGTPFIAVSYTHLTLPTKA